MAGPDLDGLASHLRDDLQKVAVQIKQAPDALLRRVFPDADDAFSTRAIVGAKVDVTGDAEARAEELATLRRSSLEGAPDALSTLRDHGFAALDGTARQSLEVAIAVVRPALFMHGGKFDNPAAPWDGILKPFKADIKELAASVGRIDVPEQVAERAYAGTGFVVRKDVVMTNCHVAGSFAQERADGGWELRPGLSPCFDVLDDPGNRPEGAAPPIPIDAVLGIHPRLDLALVRLAPDGRNPEPLTLASETPEPETGRRLIVIGYPAQARSPDAELQRSIFGDRFGVKRLQPGGTMAAPSGAAYAWTDCSARMSGDDVMFHDASTLGGNSGSCVLDLEDGVVVGSHFGGRYMGFNVAVALWALRGDPLLAGADLNWD